MKQFLIALFALLLSAFIDSGQTSDEPDFCKGVNYFKVQTGFKIDQWLALFGEIQIKDSNDKTNQSFRVFYNERGDPSEQPSTQYYYFGAKYWPEMRALAVDSASTSFNISYAFSTININIFYGQSAAHLAYLTNTNGAIYAYDIDSNRPVQSDGAFQDPTFTIKEGQLVYDPSIGEDLSKKLTLKVLLVHFPKIVKILDLLVFERKARNQKDSVYHALVYTEETKNGNSYYVRHMMVSEVKHYEDYMYRKFERLYWRFDDKNNYCQQLDDKINGVVYLRTEQAFNGFSDSNQAVSNDFIVHFIEFYATSHRLMRLQFSATTDSYVIETNSEYIANTYLLNCKTHPDLKAVSLTPCDDYPDENLDQIGSYDTADNWQGSESGSSSSNVWLTIGIIITLLLIILLIAILGYLWLTPDKEVSDKSNKSEVKEEN